MSAVCKGGKIELLACNCGKLSENAIRMVQWQQRKDANFRLAILHVRAIGKKIH